MLEMRKNWLPLMMADGADGGGDTDESTDDTGNEETKKPEDKKPEDKKPEEGDEGEKKYSDADVNKILDAKFAKWEAKKQKDIDEAKKLADMNADEKANYKLTQAEQRIAEFERKEAISNMKSEARSMLKEKGITVGDSLLGMLVDPEADKTKLAVEEFLTLFEEAVGDAVKGKLKGTPPKTGTSTKAVTKEEIMAVKDPVERRKLIQDHLELFE